MANTLRAVIVGASTLLGKELVDELNAPDKSWDIRLVDAADAGGQLVAGGDEALVVQPLTPEAFEGRDVAFFTESQATTRAHWREAQMVDAAVVDLTGALDAEQGALVLSPWVAGGNKPVAGTSIVIPAHPAAVILGVVGSRLLKAFGRMHLAATVFEPASQQGAQGMDELHRQTVSLLGFHPVPQELYDAQIAFNMRIDLGESGKVNLSETVEKIRHDIVAIAGKVVAESIAIQLVQAPVFHSYTMSIFAELPQSADEAALRRALDGGVIKFADDVKAAPSNQSVTQETEVSLSIREDSPLREGNHGYWLWLAADNLKLAARHAVACAEKLTAMTGAGTVQ